ncbi:MAG TPA: leucyl aminopeptidase [Gammaproteobacteria bacterium]|nr:leucyl aminopeptidase [Gammaproteobacteria bacterium]
MKLSLTTAQPEKNHKLCVIAGVFTDGLTPAAKSLDEESKGFISRLIKQGALDGKIGQVLPLFHLPNTKYDQILLIGCGSQKSVSPSSYRKAVSAAVKALTANKITEAVSYLTELDVASQSAAWKVKHHAEVIGDSIYCFDMFKSTKQEAPVFKKFDIFVPDSKQIKACETALKQGQAIGNGVALTKNLGNLPSNICTPSFLADKAKAVGKSFSSLSVKVLGEKEMDKLGMGALLGVSQGSAQEAQFIIMEYQGGKKNEAPVALVGKGITFDTGGNSLKPADSMVGMKYDMCGAATVIGTIHAAAELKLPVNIVGLIPAVENMPGGTAYKPEDILTSMSGQTIEVISTDAEGRLVLADALTYAERFKPDVVIDIATLTGAVVIALGYHATGLVTNYDPLAKDLLTAGEESFDRAWQLPMWEEFDEQLKSPFADMANTGGRTGGTITAGCFLSRFAKKFHWAHLDVAGTAAMMGGTSERRATGRPVPMLVQYLINRAG